MNKRDYGESNLVYIYHYDVAFLSLQQQQQSQQTRSSSRLTGNSEQRIDVGQEIIALKLI